MQYQPGPVLAVGVTPLETQHRATQANEHVLGKPPLQSTQPLPPPLRQAQPISVLGARIRVGPRTGNQ